MYRTDFWTLWEKVRVGCFKRTASKHAYYLGWNRSPAQVGCIRQVLGPGALGRPRGIGWRGRWEGGSGWGIHVNPWLIHVNVWQNPLQYCKVISLQLIYIYIPVLFIVFWRTISDFCKVYRNNSGIFITGLGLWRITFCFGISHKYHFTSQFSFSLSENELDI